MKQFCIFLSFFLSVALATLAQNVTNVRVQQEGEQIIITYDLDKTANVYAYVSIEDSEQYTLLKAVVGNVGKSVQPGTNRRIIWTPLKERTEFVAPNARFKVVALPTIHYFSVSPTKKVAFSPGNLQYHPRTNTWRFAPHQWECIGKANENISKRYKGWIDLFGWGTGNEPTKNKYDDYFVPKSNYKVFVDWGVNMIGIDQPNTWRTLTYEEWKYLFQHTRWTIAKVDTILGVMFLPDNFSTPAGMVVKLLGNGNLLINVLRYNESDYASNQYSISEFARLEARGCVFLPCAGVRFSSSAYVRSVGSVGNYWSATPSVDGRFAYEFRFIQSFTNVSDSYRDLGQSVRLVQDLR